MTHWQRFIDMYVEEIGEAPTAEQNLLLKYFKEAGEDLPLDDIDWFHCAWRKFDVIYTRGPGSKDMIVWHLLRIDDAIHRVLSKFFADS